MATTQKKKPAGKGGASRSKPSPAGKNTKSGKGAQAPPRPFRREVGAWVCLLLALFSAIGYVQDEAPFIGFLSGTFKGLAGYGFWLSAPALLLGAYTLAFHRGRPVRLRLCCALLLPLLVGCILHLFLAKEQALVWDWDIFNTLWKSGQALESGGAVSGLIADGCMKVFGKVGSAIVFILGGGLMLLAAFNRTIVDVVDAIRNRPRAEYEPVTPPAPRMREDQLPRPAVEQVKPDIDIPLGQEPEQPRRATGLFSGARKEKLFRRETAVAPPDEVLIGMRNPGRGAEADLPDLSEPPAAAPAPAPVEVEIVREPAVQKVKREETEQAAAEVARDIEKQASAPAPAYQYPPLSLLHEGAEVAAGEALNELRVNQSRLADTIRSFGIEARIAAVTRGPSVTRYEVELDQGIRLNRLTNLADDIALALGATGVRIAPIPDKISMVGIEVPNKLVTPVQAYEVIGSKEFTDSASKVSFAVGKDIGGTCIVGNIAKLPHLLIAGTTGSGKSVCTNSLIVSLLYKATPEEVRLIMIDPKMVELNNYNGIPHLLIPVVVDPKKAAGALQWAVTEMMKRYRSFSEVGVRDLASYNAHMSKTGAGDKLPQVVVVIDELADLMLVAAKEVEESICRVAQMGRAAGMHLIIATQRPSADVITGLMKANIPSRIAFAVASALESRIILDTQGAEKLVGRGDMLWFPLGAGKPLRVQGCLISDDEVSAVVDFVKKSGQAEYDETILHEIDRHVQEKEKGGKGPAGGAGEEPGGDYDELISAAIEVVLEANMASASLLQRRLKLGYARAARLVDQMEEKGVVGPFEGSKPRQVLISKQQWQEMQLRQGLEYTPPPDGFDDPPEEEPETDELPFVTEEAEL